MRILLIGNFAPPYEEENLSNISLLKRLEDEGHSCSVINISQNRSVEEGFVDVKGFPDFLLKLLRLCWRKDVIHFSTKGYLRVGLLKMMASIFAGKIFRAKTVLTFHSELFSILGQMRSPFGGTQTLYTSFFLVDKIIVADRDTFDVASMYKKESGFELVHPFINAPDSPESSVLEKIKGKDRVIIFSNVTYPSFVFELITEMLSRNSFPSGTGIVISLSELISTRLKRALEETAGSISDDLIFIEPHDLESSLAAYANARIVVRPLSCDGETFFEKFTLYIRKIYRTNNTVYYPSGLLFVKEGKTAEICSHIINTLLIDETAPPSELQTEDPYSRIKKIYED